MGLKATDARSAIDCYKLFLTNQDVLFSIKVCAKEERVSPE